MSGAERDDLVRLLREATDDHPIRPDCLAIADAILAAGWVSPERLTEMARQATAAAAERDALAATVARVEALADEWERGDNPEADDDWRTDPLGCCADALRAALDRPPHPEGTG